MFSIEEARATRQTATVNIPAGASREFGKHAVERAIEEKSAAEQAEAAKGIRATLAQAWNKLRGVDAISAQPEEATR
jgi:hypothetical protein